MNLKHKTKEIELLRKRIEYENHSKTKFKKYMSELKKLDKTKRRKWSKTTQALHLVSEWVNQVSGKN